MPSKTLVDRPGRESDSPRRAEDGPANVATSRDGPAANDPRIPFRWRSDLVVSPQQDGWQRWWIVHDPISLNYFRLGEAEYFLLARIDGRRTLGQLQDEFHARWAPERIARSELQLMVTRAWHDQLLVGDQWPGEGRRRWAARRRARPRWLAASILQLLAIRLPTVDPSGLIRALRPLGRVLFSRIAATAFAVAMLGTLLYAWVERAALTERLPALGDYLQGESLLGLALALGLVKVSHELGHALACERFGGRCNGIGLMLLAFIPCLYCDVSDSWMFASRWRRIAVAAAGIYVELILATLGFWIWVASLPGFWNALCLNVVVVCSLNTLLANGNPLLRYDGYYIASDLFRVPNLGQRSRAALAEAVRRMFFEQPRAIGLGAASPGLVAYAVAAALYRPLLIGLIVLAIYHALEPLGFGVLAVALAAAVVLSYGSMLGGTLMDLMRMARNARLRLAHVALAAAGLAGLAATLFWWPLHFRIWAPVVVQLDDVHAVFAPIEGRLVWAVEANRRVAAGDPVAQLENESLRNEHDSLQRQLRLIDSSLETLQQRAKGQEELLWELQLLESKRSDLQQQWEIVRRELDRSQVAAPVAGVVFEAEPRARSGEEGLERWSGVLLDPDNRGCLVEAGETICRVADGRRRQAVAYVGQNEIDGIEAGAIADLRLAAHPGGPLRGTVTEIARQRVDEVPPSLAAARGIAMKVDASGRLTTTEPVYRVTLRFEADPPSAAGSQGWAKIHTRPQTAWQRLLRLLRRTFRFDL